MDGCITKPIRMDVLAHVLSQTTTDKHVINQQPVEEGLRAEDVVDQGRMQDLVDSLGDGLGDVIKSFLEDTPYLIDEMRLACDREDQDDLQRVAHSLKSSSGIFGACRMVELCRDLEISSRAQPQFRN